MFTSTIVIEVESADPTWMIIGILSGICVIISICWCMMYSNTQDAKRRNQSITTKSEKEQSPSSNTLQLMNRQSSSTTIPHEINDEKSDIKTDINGITIKPITDTDFDPYHITENIIIKWFDTIMIIISLLSMLFDAIILVYLITNKQTIYYITSIIIFIVSFACYIVIYCRQVRSIESQTGFSVALIPFSPVLPMMIYLIRAKQLNVCCFLQAYNCCEFIRFCMFNEEDISIDDDECCSTQDLSAYTRWHKQSYMKHIGFVAQSLIQSFPQSILKIAYLAKILESTSINMDLQTVGIVSFSILVSVLSILTVSLIFIQTMDNKTRMFQWLCFMTDILVFYSVFYTLVNIKHDDETVQQLWTVLIVIIACFAAPFAICVVFGIIKQRKRNDCIVLFFPLMLAMNSWLSAYIRYYSIHRLRPYSKYSFTFWNRIIDAIGISTDNGNVGFIKDVNRDLLKESERKYLRLQRYDRFYDDRRQGFFHFVLTIVVGHIVNKRAHPNISWIVKMFGNLYVVSKIMMLAYVPLLMNIAYDTSQRVHLGLLSFCSLLFILCLAYGQLFVRQRFAIIKNIVPGYYVDIGYDDIPNDDIISLNSIIDRVST